MGIQHTRTPWYVVQVNTGYEDGVCHLIRQVADETVMKECFVPRYRVGKKIEGGKYVPSMEVLFPGYAIVVTDHIAELESLCRRIPKLTRVLRNDDVFISLNEEEIAWIDARAPRDDRVIDMSEGYIKNGTLHVTSGPLVGLEADVVKVNHRKKTAYVKMHILGREKIVPLGLRITRGH